ncbi:hypothetical protein chiPu_0024048, partial [Chiloscyllium punctatum]|nr:hypothetical protein [Chiloscyllium punctatum]
CLRDRYDVLMESLSLSLSLPFVPFSLKPIVLQSLQQEHEHKVRHSVAQLAAIIVKHETPEKWPQLLQFITQWTKSSVPEERQVGQGCCRPRLVDPSDSPPPRHDTIPPPATCTALW